jgi:hypothetical protein
MLDRMAGTIDERFNKINDTIKLAEKGDNNALIWCVQALTHEVRELAKKVAELKGQ